MEHLKFRMKASLKAMLTPILINNSRTKSNMEVALTITNPLNK